MAKRFLLRNILGSNAQGNIRVRTLWIGNEAGEFVLMEDTGSKEFIDDKICLNLEALGEDVQSIYVEELGTTLSRKEM
ncbi:hypothetical protein Golax_008255 [Gossypium laxum]|uniref:Uncharacterized protein n=1 Tax=Gossypium laxum TaxID=34288 RepID=A0A7J9A9A4_9ROSI|nr:hypothetical protein [Gossypium laxum]